MSRESMEWLNRNILRGFTEKRGHAWHYMASLQGERPNHYAGAIPVGDLHERLFGWHAESRSLYFDGGEAFTGMHSVADQVAWVRSDTNEVLGIHSAGYTGHQYGEWLVKAVESIVGDELQVASAGLLKNGAVAWVQIERPETIETPEGVTIRPFIMATTSFDGSIATTYKDGYTDTVCDNTRAAFLAEAGNVYRVKHTSKSGLRIGEARAALGFMEQKTEEALAEISALCGVDVSDKAWSAFLEAHAPIEDGAKGRAVTLAESKREELARLWNTDVRVTPWRGTAWGVVQAANTYMHHIQTVRNVNRVERNMLRAVKGEVAAADRDVLATLAGVCDLGEIGARVLAGAAA